MCVCVCVCIYIYIYIYIWEVHFLCMNMLKHGLYHYSREAIYISNRLKIMIIFRY